VLKDHDLQRAGLQPSERGRVNTKTIVDVEVDGLATGDLDSLRHT